MGPGDVASVASQAACDPIIGKGEEQSECSDWPDKVNGAVPEMALGYFEGELTSISVGMNAPPPTGEEGDMVVFSWRNNLRDAMVKKYGRPKKEDGLERGRGRSFVSDRVYQTSWDRPGVTVVLTIGGTSASVHYYDPERTLRAAKAEFDETERKAKVSADDL